MKKSDEKTAFRIIGLENSQPQNGAPFFLFFGGGCAQPGKKSWGLRRKTLQLDTFTQKTMANLGSRWVVSHTYTWRQMASIAKPFGTHKRQSSHQTIASGFSWNQEDVHWNFHMLRPIPPFGPRCEKSMNIESVRFPWFSHAINRFASLQSRYLVQSQAQALSKKRSQGSFGCDRRSPCVILDHANITGYGRAKHSNVGTGSNEAFGLQTQTEKKQTTEKSWKAPVPNAEDCNVVWTYLALSVT